MIRPPLRDYLRSLYQASGWRLTVTVLLAALCSLTEGIGILLLIPTLEVAGVSLGADARMQSYAAIADHALRRIGLTPSLAVLLALFLALISARTIMVKMQMVAGAAVQQRLLSHLRESLHRAIVSADWIFLCRKKSSDLVHVLTGEVERVGTVTTLTLMLAGEILVTSVYVIVAGVLSPGVTLLVVGAGLFLALLLKGKTRMIAGVGTEVSRTNQLLYAAIITHVQNLKTTKAYNAERRDEEGFAHLNALVADTFNEAARRRAFGSGWFEIGSFFILSAAVYVSLGAFTVGPAGILILLLIFARLMPRIVAAYADYQGIVNQLPAFSAIAGLEHECRTASEPHRIHDEKIGEKVREKIRL